MFMKKLILEWQNLWIPEYTPRLIVSPFHESKVKKVYLFTGCRRTGKTYFLFQIIDQLTKEFSVEKKNIIYLNFEDERIEWKTQILTDLLPTLAELFGEKEYYLFLDEIHHIPNWSRWVTSKLDGSIKMASVPSGKFASAAVISSPVRTSTTSSSTPNSVAAVFSSATRSCIP